MLENASSSPLMEIFSSDRRLSGSTSTSWQDRVCWSQQGWLLLDKLLGDFENNSFEETAPTIKFRINNLSTRSRAKDKLRYLLISFFSSDMIIRVIKSYFCFDYLINICALCQCQRIQRNWLGNNISYQSNNLQRIPFFKNILYGSASVTCKPDFKSFYNLF